jgi:hypothetical protein
LLIINQIDFFNAFSSLLLLSSDDSISSKRFKSDLDIEIGFLSHQNLANSERGRTAIARNDFEASVYRVREWLREDENEAYVAE